MEWKTRAKAKSTIGKTVPVEIAVEKSKVTRKRVNADGMRKSQSPAAASPGSKVCTLLKEGENLKQTSQKSLPRERSLVAYKIDEITGCRIFVNTNKNSTFNGIIASKDPVNLTSIRADSW